MKKIKKYFILIFVLFFICDVKAASIYLDDEDGSSFSSLSAVTTHCDDDVCTDVTGNINSVLVANGYIMPIKVVFSKYDNENISEIKVTINSSSGISCSLTNLFDDFYDLNNNNFILKETMYDTKINDFGGKDIGDIASEYHNGGYGNFKKYCAFVTVNKIKDIQDRYNELIESGEIDKILKNGLEKSRLIAKEKCDLVKERVGLI